VRANVAAALGHLGDCQVVEPLIAALADQYSSVRRDAAWALGRIGDARAVASPLEALKDKCGAVRRAAAHALVSLYHDGGLDAVARKLILAGRAAITRHHDVTGSSNCGHSDHNDIGIGVDFLAVISHSCIRLYGV
jgi:HEAT repeat protein